MSQPGALVDAPSAASGFIARAVGIGKRLDGRDALADITLDIGRGECIALLGTNGAGKSTLLRVLATLTAPTSGVLELFGAPAARDAASARARTGMIGHQIMLYRDLTVRENLEFFGRLYRIERWRERARGMLELLGLGDRADDPVRTLSRGTAQRASIARALMHRPDLLLADEPFTGLDGASARLVEDLFVAMRDEGRTVLLATHDIDQALRLAQRVVLLRDGRVEIDDHASRIERAALLGRLNPNGGRRE